MPYPSGRVRSYADKALLSRRQRGSCDYRSIVNLHLQKRSSGWGSRGACTHSTLIDGSISHANAVNSPRCISLQAYSPSPLLSLAALSGAFGTFKMTSSEFSTISKPTIICHGKYLTRAGEAHKPLFLDIEPLDYLFGGQSGGSRPYPLVVVVGYRCPLFLLLKKYTKTRLPPGNARGENSCKPRGLPYSCR